MKLLTGMRILAAAGGACQRVYLLFREFAGIVWVGLLLRPVASP